MLDICVGYMCICANFPTSLCLTAEFRERPVGGFMFLV